MLSESFLFLENFESVIDMKRPNGQPSRRALETSLPVVSGKHVVVVVLLDLRPQQSLCDTGLPPCHCCVVVWFRAADATNRQSVLSYSSKDTLAVGQAAAVRQMALEIVTTAAISASLQSLLCPRPESLGLELAPNSWAFCNVIMPCTDIEGRGGGGKGLYLIQ